MSLNTIIRISAVAVLVSVGSVGAQDMDCYRSDGVDGSFTLSCHQARSGPADQNMAVFGFARITWLSTNGFKLQFQVRAYDPLYRLRLSIEYADQHGSVLGSTTWTEFTTIKTGQTKAIKVITGGPANFYSARVSVVGGNYTCSGCGEWHPVTVTVPFVSGVRPEDLPLTIQEMVAQVEGR